MTTIATLNGVTIASSEETVVVEGNHYFPQADVNFEFLEPTRARSLCFWKGIANYWTRVAFWNGIDVRTLSDEPATVVTASRT